LLRCLTTSLLLFVPGATALTAEPAQTPDEQAERARFVGVWRGFTVEGKGETPDRGPVKLELTITERPETFETKKGQFLLILKKDAT